MLNKEDFMEAFRKRETSEYGINEKISEKDKARHRARVEIERRKMEREYEEQNKDLFDSQ